MHSLQKQFHDFIKSRHLFDNKQKVLLAVSGGLDSMVLADLFLRSDYNFALAHCNFGLRGTESDADEMFVINWAQRNDIQHYAKRFDLPSGSIQLAARNARYKWFRSLADEHGYDFIATAHHLNDSLETALINLTRGTGVKGLKGIDAQSGDLVRPLMFADRGMLAQYAGECQIEWREDSSNSKLDYNRNRIRHNVIPELEELNASLQKTFLLTSERLSLTTDLVLDQVEQISSQYLRETDDKITLGMSWINKKSDLIILATITEEYGFNYQTTKEIYQALDRSGKVFISEKWILSIDRDQIVIQGKEKAETVDFTIESEGIYKVGSHTIEVVSIPGSDVKFGDDYVGHFNLSSLSFPIRIRNWELGDRFRPLGMRGQKKVSDFLIDEKVSIADKRMVLVMECQGKIGWLVGYRISEDFKLMDQKEEVLRVTIRKAGS